jgi:hypothetical protein
VDVRHGTFPAPATSRCFVPTAAVYVTLGQENGLNLQFSWTFSLLLCLTTVLASRLHSVDERIVKEYGAVHGMRIGKGNKGARRKLPQCYFVYNKFNKTYRRRAIVMESGRQIFTFQSLVGGGGGVKLGPLGTSATNCPIVLPTVIMRMENLVKWRLAGKTEVLGENLPQCHFVHHKSHMTWSGANPGRCSGKPATNLLSYGTAKQGTNRWSYGKAWTWW